MHENHHLTDAEGEVKALADIEQYGCHVLHVSGDDELPPFSYSAGIQRSNGAPEVIVVGLKQELSHFMVNEYNRRVSSGEIFNSGQRLGGLLDGYDCELRAVHPDWYRTHFGWDIWLYGGVDFRALQIVYPTVGGTWPWDAEASDWFKRRQPVLDRPASE